MIIDNTFSEACYNDNSIEELEHALTQQADQIDMRAWNLTEGEWRSQIKLALAEKKKDEAEKF